MTRPSGSWTRLALLLLTGCFSMMPLMAGTKYPNPLIYQRADPWILLHEGRYYFIATVPDYDRIELRAADSVEGLACADPKTVWRKHDSGPMSHHIWAPELHRIDGAWYIHFAAGRSDQVWAIRMYVLENTSEDPLEGEWTEKGPIGTPWDTFSLDATVFEHEGRHYLVWAQHEPGFDGNTALWIAEMDSPASITGEPVKLTEPEFEWETQLYKVNEGAAVLKRNGRIYITYSASGTDHNYAMGLLVAKQGTDLLDPRSWKKSPKPVFRSSDENGIYGPGHNSFTRAADGTDLLVYHARNYKEIDGDPLQDPNRHTRVQPFGWDEDGFPVFGEPWPETPGEAADRPLYRDPVHDGAADPVVIWNPERARWWMFYTNRRANVADAPGVSWVHGTHIGIAESCDGGASWQHVGRAVIELPGEVGGESPTFWAPDVVTDENGGHHMFLTVVPGVFEDWNHPRSIIHLTSADLRHWRYASTLDLSSDRVIDAAVAQMPDGQWHMWYNDERENKSIRVARSSDLSQWKDLGQAVGDQPGEGPKVFHWKGCWWMVTDVWEGLAVYRSADAREWRRQKENLLSGSGGGPDDQGAGHHADVVVQGDRAFLFYFTHPGRGPDSDPAEYRSRRSVIHVTELHLQDGRLTTDRDQPVRIKLDPGRVSAGR